MTDQTAPNPSPFPQIPDEILEPSPGKPEFDEAARRNVIAMIANGSSRRAAARYVGCAPSTITRAAARDPQFAAELARAESAVEIRALTAVRNAANTDRYWRAAAWLLEKKNPADFDRRSDGGFTAELPNCRAGLAHVRRTSRLAPSRNPRKPARPSHPKAHPTPHGDE